MKHIPHSTYRIQLNHTFAFKNLKAILTYLSELGITDIYASPIFKARKGSMHGYDVVDPTQLNPELGSEDDFSDLVAEAKKLNLSWLQDVVPNHMAYDSQNDILMDVLENGPHSQYAHYFDIEWQPHYSGMDEKILAPFLGTFFGKCLENGKIELKYSEDGLSIHYYDHKFPVRIHSYIKLITHNLRKLRGSLTTEHPDYIKLLGVLYVLKNIPTDDDETSRYDQITFVKRMLWELYQRNPDYKEFFDENIQNFNGTAGEPESFSLLNDLLDEQFYRLSFWKVGTEEINYRRFFYVNELISLRTEQEEVFDKIHSKLFEWIGENKIDGIRIDHVDGLYNPTEYLKRLRKYAAQQYIVVEKILELKEALPENWNIEGTTGYDFMNYVNGLFCLRDNAYLLDKIYRKFTGFDPQFENLLHAKKRLIIGKHMAGDIDNLAHRLAELASAHRYAIDFTLYGLRRSLVEVLSWFPVYRTYNVTEEITENERHYIEEAVSKAKLVMPDFENEFNFIKKILLLKFDENLPDEEKQQWIHFTLRFQQMTGPLMAKGLEDTVMYNFNRLISLNEVGGQPGKFGISSIEFHYFNKNRINIWAHSMNTTSTHDAKRGEDVRARLNVLSEIPQQWEKNFKIWARINQPKKKNTKNGKVPDRNDEYFLYQTLIGTFPFYESELKDYPIRIKEYMIKAIREAKIHTAWLQPDSEYEDAMTDFIEKVLDFSDKNVFLKEFLPFQKKIAFYGMFNSFSQTLLKITSPGVPDMYQGTELWDLTLVDPDNRRSVDFNKRRKFLNQIKRGIQKNTLSLIEELFKDAGSGRIKMFLIFRALQIRNKYHDLFRNGSYIPLEIEGSLREHVIAFARNYQRQWIVVAVPRFLTSMIKESKQPDMKDIWEDTRLIPPARINKWRNAITDQEIQGLNVGEIMRHFPAGLLIGEE
ncbi:malto-oligosyltrehalose synthase [candidate division KSB1 bacterium]|nr:malto-oligosyltrehalose synthase [candidate division KSB1 bacterium]